MSHQLVLPLRVTRDGKLSPFGNLVAEMKVELLAELGKRFLLLVFKVRLIKIQQRLPFSGSTTTI